jgi:hypothetical protein
MAKATKTQANYRKGAADKHCVLCTTFCPPESCTAVAGRIELNFVCDFFKRTTSRAERW